MRNVRSTTGKRAFRGKNSTDTMLAILGKDPEPIRSLNTEVPQAVDLIVHRCLEKQPGERFESARDVAFSLKALADSQGTGPNDILPPKPSSNFPLRFVLVVLSVAFPVVAGWFVYSQWIAAPPPVLPEARHLAIVPFVVANGGDSDVEFAAGLTEILASDLSILERQGYGRFWVVPIGDARYLGASTVGELYRVFNPTMVLTGGLNRSGSTVDINIALVEPKSERTIRSRTVQAYFGNVSSFQIDPILGVTEMLEVEFKQDDREWLAGRTTNVAPAFELYVRAEEFSAQAPILNPQIVRSPCSRRR